MPVTPWSFTPLRTARLTLRPPMASDLDDLHALQSDTEVVREVALLRVAFDELGLHRVTAELDPRNDASVALCTRLGMRREAHFVEDVMVKGDWADTGVYAILEREWRAQA